MLKFLKIVTLITICNVKMFSQKISKEGFISPLDIPLYLSGNYGELRADHFHVGIDIKTMGEPGKPVYASMEGYISRIKVQIGGYGKSIYINHPNGYTTVYAHLDKFMPDVEEYVTKAQYVSKSFEVDLYPTIYEFQVEEGQKIALSGNTGSSGGPHLHFEIRKSADHVPVNALSFNLPVSDRRFPEFKSLYAYSFATDIVVANNGEIRKYYPVVKLNDSTYTVPGNIITRKEYVGFASEVYDFLDGSENKCGIRVLELIIDKKLLFSFEIDNISFGLTRYINAHMDYNLKSEEKRSVHRLYKLPNNKLPIYKGELTDKLLHINDNLLHQGEIAATDIYGNKSVLKFNFKKASNINNSLSDSNNILVLWKYGILVDSLNYKFRIPADALYQDTYLQYEFITGEENSLSDTLILHHESEPLHRNVNVILKVNKFDPGMKNKLLIVRMNNEKKIISEAGKFENGYLKTSSRSFGKFYVSIDTVAPSIKSGLTDSRKYSVGDKLIFTVTDDLSGIWKYNAYIDNEWVLLEYDAKTDQMFYTIDEKRLVPGKKHELKVIVVDERNNQSVSKQSFEF
ncbi:MAG: M23 family metallopeptidase [Bacteroidales bacterium]|nr:M23 family metallopeptidase [Bacteroidales bacterium]